VNSPSDPKVARKIAWAIPAVSHWSVQTFLIWLVLACLLPGVIGTAILIHYEYREGRAQMERNTLRPPAP
jgi:hypothetical protein